MTKEKLLMTSHAEVCPVCRGEGAEKTEIREWDSGSTKVCHGCGGKGWITVRE